MVIAIDFDGTCVTHEFPNVGKDIGATPIIKKIVEKGHKIILFTMRSYKEGVSPVTEKLEDGGLVAAVKWFEEREIPLYGVNVNPSQIHWTNSPKVYAQLYIDDAAAGCPLKYDPDICARPYVDWEKIEQILIDLNII